MSDIQKLSGEERRNYILQLLKRADSPIKGQQIAKETGVSRQVIVTDIALLKSRNEPIIATNLGYLYMKEALDSNVQRRIIICQHTPEETAAELNAIVDCGVTVTNVIIEHPVYGDLTGSLLLSSRFDVEQFLTMIEEKNATLLSVLTGGVHLHTLEADSVEKLDAACKALDELGFLYKDLS